ncbi:type II secretion system pilot lipoprotein GspS-beta [Vibrio sp. V31_P5A7T61]|uniref:GspS/AspS pilotin family protein n=2 Tax=Vibrio TaxID=662 RepID=UPI0013724BCD|nr:MULTISPECIES: GspS/AspS pilotin family protein [unclassified Vibrio]NAW63232.1 type II secretion system pilot lipoprotein GspS-beta [Vibrio sp. V31_P5A7T61]NAX02056.1 type II secretion system pilot lipoprotein GspS-beta [Vibrio sp. V34_P3A8T189]NAX64434.1 type II secretion system pilot lipoprotein GspS-beta [Vibrio sp. V32_P6A28T40]
MNKLLLSCVGLTMLLLAGCSSTADQQKHLELLAANRASVLNAELPIEQGPLTIMRASAKGIMIEMMMIYNNDQQGATPIDQVMQSSLQRFCSTPDIRANLDVGISYRFLVRNPRGQTMVDQSMTKSSCK